MPEGKANIGLYLPAMIQPFDGKHITQAIRDTGMSKINRTIGCIFLLVLSMNASLAQADGSLQKHLFVENARGYGQCEILVINKDSGNLYAQVYNTTGLNDCPAGQFDQIGLKQLAIETGAYMVWKNPRRVWVADNLTISSIGEPRDFAGLHFNYIANMQMPPGFVPSTGQSGYAYQPLKIPRVCRLEYLKGSQVYLLRSPDGHTWVMQSYTNHTDLNLSMADLPVLAGKLTLPAGWQFKAKTLDRNLIIDAKGIVNIVPDDLENMYQGCIDNACNYDPWN